MESSILLKQTYDLIETIENAENEQKKEEIFDRNFEQFIQFYFDIDAQISQYQYKDLKDEKQCEKSDKFFSIVKWIIQNDKLFLRNEDFSHIPNEVIRKYGNEEEYHAFSLMMDGSIDKINSERDHFGKRDIIEELLKNKKDLSNAQKDYLNGRLMYYQYYFGHALPYLDAHFTEVPEEEIIKIIKEIEESHILDDIITSENKKLKFEDGSNLVFQYITFVLKVKSIFKPQEVCKDNIIQSFWQGKIKNHDIIKYLFSQDDNEDLRERKGIKSGQVIDYEGIFKYFLKLEGWNGKDNFYIELLNHFNKVGISQENINVILINIIPIIGTYDAAEFFNNIYKYPQINNNSYLMELLQKEEKRITEGSTINIPFSYALKNIANMSEEMKQNLITLVHSNFYKEEEKRILIEKLKQHGIIHDISEEKQIKFEENDTLEETISKAKLSYENRQVMPIDVAKKFLNLHSKKEISLDEELLKSCVVSIISNILNEKGINIESNVFFGKDKNTNGINHARANFRGIWLNNDLIKKYIENGDMKLFITMFHEMRHSVQNQNIENGNIDYLTYNFIKENILRKRDQDFYNFNYRKMFIEEDARQFGIIDALKFMKETDILMYEDFKKYCEELTNELNNSNINQDSNKENPFRTKGKINISDYLGKMIKNNPAILNEYNGILKIEYNLDGTTKDIATMLKEYRNLGEMNEQERKNYYSIYYGIISRKITKDLELPEDVEADLTEFIKEKKELISVEDMRYYFKKAEPLVTKNILKRLLSFSEIGEEEKQSEGGEHGDN